MTVEYIEPRVSWPRPATHCDLAPAWAGEFRDFNDWVSFATTRLTGTYDPKMGVEVTAICIDSLGRRCTMGGHFMRARDEGAFPVRFFWDMRPSERSALLEADLRLEVAAHSATALRLKEAEKALTACRQTIDEQMMARVGPDMPFLTREVVDDLGEQAEVSHAMAMNRKERVSAHGLAMLVEWQRKTPRPPQPEYRA